MSEPGSSPPSPSATLPPDLPTARPFRFTWDPASRRRGPESVSGTTDGRGADYIAPTLGFLNTSSTATLPLTALPAEWSCSRHGFNAISTVLNHPNKRQAPPKPHSTLPAVPPADLPRVRRKDFDSYIRAVAPEWETYQRNSQLGRDGQARLSTPRTSLSSAADVSSHTPIPPLDSVSPIFFSQTFDLGDPRTFATVTNYVPLSLPGTAKAANDDPSVDTQLLDRLSQYADTVEQHLITEISIRSTSFFAALTNLQDLQAESEQCLDRIARMRRLLQDVDEQGAKRGLEIVRTESKLANVSRVQDGIKMVAGVTEMAGVAKGLVNAGQWGQALDMIEELEKLWDGPDDNGEGSRKTDKVKRKPNGHPKLSPMAEEDEEGSGEKEQHHSSKAKQDFPLSSLQAFSSLPTHLRELTLEIASSLSSEVVGVLRIDLNERILKNSLDGNTAEQNLRDRLMPLLHGLVRTNGLKEATLSWREVILGEIKGIIKARLPGFDADDDSDDSGLQNGQADTRAALVDHLRTMSHNDFSKLIRGIYRNLFNSIEGIQIQGSVLMDVINIIIKRHETKLPPDTTLLQADLNDILCSVTEVAHIQMARVITSRTEQHAALELPQFLAFFHESWEFVIRCETLCRRMIVGLRGAVVSQAKAFLQAFHQVRLTRSAKLVEDEQWNQTEVPSSLQHLTETILDCAVHDSPELVIKHENPLWSPPSSATLSSSVTLKFVDSADTLIENNLHPHSAATSPAKNLRIDDRSYFIVSATAEVLGLLQDYLRLVINLTLLTTDTMSRVIEFLKAFNSRTCQVVLGAGAMRSAGLKNITAKHLSLASQSLSVMFELIPYVRETFRRHLSPKQAVMLVEFDKLKRDFQEHQNEIHAKLIGIMSDRLNAHIKTLQSVDLSTSKPGNAVNDYMEVLVRETVTLHKVLTRYLAIPTVEYVMTQVLAAINHRLSEEYGKIEIPNQEAKSRLLADAKYLHQKLSALKHIGTPSSMLETVIAERRTASAGEAAQVTSPRSDQSPQSQQKSLSRSATITASANQRLRGLLSGRSPTFDKMMGPRKETLPSPHVSRTSSPEPTEPPASMSVTSLLSPGGSSASTSMVALVDGGGGASGVGLPLVLSGSSESRGASGTDASSRPEFRRMESQVNDEEVSEAVIERNSPREEDGVRDGNVTLETASTLPE
ncbi:hypothetical protein APHAL10511_001006 [Amanita phalloides]|nr:hypothetical protein APHAL10511_001006 [Amanita phalloides]